jgi:DNA topoisomerase-1
MAESILTSDDLDLNIVTDPVEAAEVAGLVYTSDEGPGIRRRRAGKGFTYVGPDGKTIRDEEERARIESLAIPPAWTDVWICPDPNGHILATGRDAKGRKQYRYHPRWREVRDETKYARMILFGETLPTIRERVEEDLRKRGLTREKVLATVTRLLETTFIRVGNDEYARNNHSFGLTTMRDRHVDVEGSTIHFEFRGKSGVKHSIDLQDRRLARIVKKCRDIPGYNLFQYYDEAGQRQAVTSTDVNSYIRSICGQAFTAKDFRTWAGTVLAFRALCQHEPCDTETQANKNIVQAVKEVAAELGNTPAVCRKCYIHPHVLDAYTEGALLKMVEEKLAQEPPETPYALNVEEEAVLLVLRMRAAEQLAT